MSTFATDRIIAGNSFSHTGPMTGPIIAPVGMSGGVWDGANFSSRRGYVYAPLQTRDELPSGSRTELVRRSRWLTRNVGFAKRCVYGD